MNTLVPLGVILASIITPFDLFDLELKTNSLKG